MYSSEPDPAGQIRLMLCCASTHKVHGLVRWRCVLRYNVLSACYYIGLLWLIAITKAKRHIFYLYLLVTSLW